MSSTFLHELPESASQNLGDSPVEHYCTGLRTLVLHGTPRNIQGLLRVVGPTLNSITCRDDIARGQLEHIKEFCPNLRRIPFDITTEEDRTSIADLLCSYGLQLLSANIGSFPTALCERILGSCPNLCCDVDEDVDISIPTAKMNVLGNWLHLADTVNEPGVNEVASALRSCVHL